MVIASIGEERLHGVDQEVVVDQAGGYVGGQELLDFFENGVFSRAGGAVEDNDLAARGSLNRFVFVDEVQWAEQPVPLYHREGKVFPMRVSRRGRQGLDFGL